MKVRNYLCAAVIAGVVVAGCDRQPQAWDEASSENTIAAYDTYLEDYPDGEHAAEARARRDSLAEAEAWQRAEEADSVEAYEAYLADHAGGDHAAQARDRVAEARAGDDWAEARSSNNAEAYAAYARNHPDDPRAAEARLLGKMLGGIESGRPENIGKVRARVVSIEGGEIVVMTLDTVRLGNLTVPPREMAFNAESSPVEGAPDPQVDDVVTLYLTETAGDGEDAEARVIGVLAVTPDDVAEPPAGADTDTD
jgi:hypothetical protein